MASAQGVREIVALMQRLHDISQLNLDGCSLTIGSFDGVHVGHQALIQAMVANAKEQDLHAVMVSFFPHPAVVLGRRHPPSYLTSSDEKAELVRRLGVTHLVTMSFDERLSLMGADEYLAMLLRHTSMRHLWIGENFALGHRREGNSFYLDKASARLGFSLHVQSPERMGGEVVSSSRIREALRSGDVAHAASYLGRWYAIPGELIAAPVQDRSLEIPTYAVRFWDERAVPGEGVYAVRVESQAGDFNALALIDACQTDGLPDGSCALSVHPLQDDIAPHPGEVRVIFIETLRGKRDFVNSAAAQRQLARDVRRARAGLKQAFGD